MTEYIIKTPAELTFQEIKTILDNWQLQEWMKMDADSFRQKFRDSEFHFLVDESGKILCIARINFNFTIRTQTSNYSFAELVGLVAVMKNKGYGFELVKNITAHLRDKNIEAIGFCEKQLRPFYEKCSVHILHDKAKRILEKNGDQWVPSTDDDILVLNLSDAHAEVLENLSNNNPGYFES